MNQSQTVVSQSAGRLIPFSAAAEQTQHDIGYVRHLASGNVVITRIETGVRIMCLPGAFRRITGVDIRSTYAGRTDISYDDLISLGFVRKEVTPYDDVIESLVGA